jgi:DNA-binding NarL/FixJ family response regulator
MIQVLVIDDHALVREGLKRALMQDPKVKVIGEAASKKEAFAQIAHHNPDVIVIDLHLPDGSGLDIIRWARSNSKKIGIVVLTMSDMPEYIVASLDAGASAFVEKISPTSEVIAAIYHSAKAPLSFTTRRLSDVLAVKKERHGLTGREIEVLELLPLGETVTEMALNLIVSESTIKTHISAIYRKFEVNNRMQAINIARKKGLLK